MNASQGDWTLTIDFGTSFTVVAATPAGRSAEIVEIDGERRTPSVVAVDDAGEMRVGRAAENAALSQPNRSVRGLKSRLGEAAPVILAGRPYDVVDLVAALFRSVAASAARERGSLPADIALTHPAAWGQPRLQKLLDAAARAGLLNVTPVPEPIAAARLYSATTMVEVGQHVAVYDLGGGTFDATLLRAESDGFAIVGRPNADTNLGGEVLDELLVNKVGQWLDTTTWQQLQVSAELPWQRAAAALRAECRRAKEALSNSPYVDLVLPLPTGMSSQRLSREELEELVRPYAEESVRLLLRTANDAGIDPQSLAAVYLVGGASRMPLVERVIQAAMPSVPISHLGDPRSAVALGATALRSTTTMSEPVLPLATDSAPTVMEASSDSTATAMETPAGARTVFEPIEPTRSVGAIPPNNPGAPAPGPIQAPVEISAKKSGRRVPVLIGAVVGALLVGGGAFAATRNSDAKATSPTTTAAAAESPVSIGGKKPPITLPKGPAKTLPDPEPTTTLPGRPSTTLPGRSPTTPPSAPPSPSTSAPKSPTTPPPTAPPTAPPTPAPTAPPTTPPPVADPQAAVDKMVLSPEDVATAAASTGWQTGTYDRQGPLCGLALPPLVAEGRSQVINNDSDATSIYVTTSAYALGSPEELKSLNDVIAQTANACPDKHIDANEQRYELEFIAPSEPKFPTIEYAIQFGYRGRSNVGQPITGYVTYAAAGQYAVRMEYQTFGRAFTEADLTATRKAFVAQVVRLLVRPR
jgi:molecular chaperone DnaK